MVVESSLTAMNTEQEHLNPLRRVFFLEVPPPFAEVLVRANLLELGQSNQIAA